jgi:hypothetical protein
MQHVSGSYCIGVLQGAVTHNSSLNSSLQVWWANVKDIVALIPPFSGLISKFKPKLEFEEPLKVDDYKFKFGLEF